MRVEEHPSGEEGYRVLPALEVTPTSTRRRCSIPSAPADHPDDAWDLYFHALISLSLLGGVADQEVTVRRGCTGSPPPEPRLTSRNPPNPRSEARPGPGSARPPEGPARQRRMQFTPLALVAHRHPGDQGSPRVGATDDAGIGRGARAVRRRPGRAVRG